MTDYQDIEKRFRRLGALQEAAGLLQWDTATLMPEGGAGARAEQSATLALVCHEILTDPAIGDLLDGAERQNDLDALAACQICARCGGGWLHATAVPGRSCRGGNRAPARTVKQIWRRARPASDFAMVLPALPARPSI